MTAFPSRLDPVEAQEAAFLPTAPAHAVLRFDGSDAALTDRLLVPLRGAGRIWWTLFVLSTLGVGLFVGCIWYTVAKGIGVWGNNIPVAWAFAITDFVWWIGIGHAGTFISAFLLLLNQHWRASINRIAEAMTLFALINAGLFPLLHLGRPWFFYWLVPYPATMGVWPNFKSALPWDIAAVSTYLTVSLLFWYVGLVPDLATARDHSTSLWTKRAYGLFALGWRGSSTQWRQHRIAYVLLAAIATPLVVSVHSVVSLDFAIAQLPGWHSTIFPPYFVVGAIYSGFAMVLLLVLPLALGVQARRRHYRAAPRCDGQADARDGAHARLLLRDRALHELVQQRSARAVHLSHRAPVRHLRGDLLDHDGLQRADASALLVEALQDERAGASSPPAWPFSPACGSSVSSSS